MKLSCAKRSCISLDICDIDESVEKTWTRLFEKVLVNEMEQISW